jgi:asparagine N-glycosylation enzyme membrane subunit Stt3
MGWMVVTTLLIFYALGVAVFHAPSVQILPGVAIIVLIADRWLVWKYSQQNTDSAQR